MPEGLEPVDAPPSEPRPESPAPDAEPNDSTTAATDPTPPAPPEPGPEATPQLTESGSGAPAPSAESSTNEARASGVEDIDADAGAPRAAAPVTEPKSAPPIDPAPSFDAATLAAMDAAMTEATEVPPDEPAPVSPPAAPSSDDRPHPGAAEAAQAAAALEAEKPRAIRGPRTVQGGREYRKGIVVSVGPEDIFVEFGPKELGVVPRVQYKDADGNEPDLPTVGAELEVAVNKFEAKESLYICSRPGLVQKAEWELLEPGQVVEARCTGVNKGGLELEVAGHRAFMPASQVDVRRIDDLSIFVGEKLQCQVQKIDRFGKGNIVLTRRDLVKQELEKNKAELREKLKEGESVQGVVKKLMPFGAFVDIGGTDALLHIGDMSHDRIRKPEDVVKEGDTLTVKVLTLDWEKNRHAVGLKQLQADPFETATAAIEEGAEVSGRITKLMEFGCFVEIAPGTEGLVHISELDWKRVNKVSDVVQPNQVVQVKVLKIDPTDRRISLSIKQTKEPPKGSDGGGKGRGGGGRGRGRGERDDRSPDEILKETPQLRRMREKAKQREHEKQEKSKAKATGKSGGGLGDLGDFGGLGLGDLKL
ncbi:MAG: S1 RNA-binding domain-containing protein [Planctomycetota bacterium]